jgi:hypothetical protein
VQPCGFSTLSFDIWIQIYRPYLDWSVLFAHFRWPGAFVDLIRNKERARNSENSREDPIFRWRSVTMRNFFFGTFTRFDGLVKVNTNLQLYACWLLVYQFRDYLEWSFIVFKSQLAQMWDIEEKPKCAISRSVKKLQFVLFYFLSRIEYTQTSSIIRSTTRFLAKVTLWKQCRNLLL